MHVSLPHLCLAPPGLPDSSAPVLVHPQLGGHLSRALALSPRPPSLSSYAHTEPSPVSPAPCSVRSGLSFYLS